MAATVSVTPAAAAAIRRLEAAHGPVTLFVSGGCCEGSSPICLRADELPAGPGDIRLGEVAGAPFYIDGDQYRRWGEPDFVLDLEPGAAEGFSLEGLDGVHFVTRAGTRSRPPSVQDRHLIELVDGALTDPNLHTDARLRIREEITTLLKQTRDRLDPALAEDQPREARPANAEANAESSLPEVLESVLVDPNLHTDTRMRLHREIAQLLRAHR